MGIDQRTGQYMIHSDDSIKLARTVVRVPNVEKWDRDSLSAVKATPPSLHVPKGMEVVFREKVDIEIAPEKAQKGWKAAYLAAAHENSGGRLSHDPCSRQQSTNIGLHPGPGAGARAILCRARTISSQRDLRRF